MTARNRPTSTARTARAARARLAAVAATAGAAMTGAAMLALAIGGPAASASVRTIHKAAVQVNCSAVPSACGYPDATNSGVPGGFQLRVVPFQVSSGPGWHYVSSGGYVSVNGNGAVLSGLYIPYNVDITASNVTIANSRVVTGGSFAISLRHTSGVTIKNSTISGTNASTGRAGVGISDIYGDSTGMTVAGNNIYYFKTAIGINTGSITRNYVHNPGYANGDHTNGVFDTGSTQPLSIIGNTILNSFDQTDAISLDASTPGSAIANKTVEDNLLGGGGYTIYGGNTLGNTSSHMLIENNRFSQAYSAKGGHWGPVAYFNTSGTNVWSGNVWDSTGAIIP
jgi:hypothetical protein